jgi:DNA-binding CsgD family transcriptional regulator
MDKQQAQDFVQDLLDHIVTLADVDSLTNYYHEDVIGHYGDIDFTFSDIENRINYLQTVFKDRAHIIHEVIKADDKIIFRDRQIVTHRKTNALWPYEVTGIYNIRNGKVSELWLMMDKDVDYQESPSHGLENSLPNEDDKAAQQHFRQLVQQEKFMINGELTLVELTEREFDTLFYTMRGLTAKKIAQRLNLSYRTIESYLETLKEKFGCDSKTELRRKITPGAIWI